MPGLDEATDGALADLESGSQLVRSELLQRARHHAVRSEKLAVAAQEPRFQPGLCRILCLLAHFPMQKSDHCRPKWPESGQFRGAKSFRINPPFVRPKMRFPRHENAVQIGREPRPDESDHRFGPKGPPSAVLSAFCLALGSPTGTAAVQVTTFQSYFGQE